MLGLVVLIVSCVLRSSRCVFLSCVGLARCVAVLDLRVLCALRVRV